MSMRRRIQEHDLLLESKTAQEGRKRYKGADVCEPGQIVITPCHGLDEGIWHSHAKADVLAKETTSRYQNNSIRSREMTCSGCSCRSVCTYKSATMQTNTAHKVRTHYDLPSGANNDKGHVS